MTIRAIAFVNLHLALKMASTADVAGVVMKCGHAMIVVKDAAEAVAVAVVVGNQNKVSG